MIATAAVLAPTKVMLIPHSRKSATGFMLPQKTLLETIANKNVFKMTLANSNYILNEHILIIAPSFVLLSGNFVNNNEFDLEECLED